MCKTLIHVESDKIVAINVRTVCSDPLPIIGMYVPDTDQPLHKYAECLAVLEHIECSKDGTCLLQEISMPSLECPES